MPERLLCRKSGIQPCRLLFAALLSLACAALAGPAKPIRLIIPFPPAGSSDIIGRELANRLSARLATPIVVENRGGANGLIGSQALLHAAPDGRTLMFHILTSHVANAAIYPRLPFDVQKDFSSISWIGSASLVYAAHPSFPAKNIAELVGVSKSMPQGLSVGSFGRASMAHVSILVLADAANAKVAHIPYSGSGPAVMATISGEVPVSVVGLAAALPYIKSGRLRPLAVTSTKRSPQLPDVPAVGEYPDLLGYSESLTYGFLAPARTPESVIRSVNEAVVALVQSPETQARLGQLGVDEIVGSTPAEMDAYIGRELSKLRQVLDSNRIKLD
jgi:tripartite-type tricarboxylate transporter receptor subunit TctC